MDNYTIDLVRARPGDILAFQVCEPRIVSRGEFYIDEFWQIGRYCVSEQSCKPYRFLIPIDPHRMTIDGERCVRERFTVRKAAGSPTWYVTETETNRDIAGFYVLAAARDYAAWRNRSKE